ncbi:MAG: hypothetical protein AAGC55_11020, partial [Myxococcota bacterium]
MGRDSHRTWQEAGHRDDERDAYQQSGGGCSGHSWTGTYHAGTRPTKPARAGRLVRFPGRPDLIQVPHEMFPRTAGGPFRHRELRTARGHPVGG